MKQPTYCTNIRMSKRVCILLITALLIAFTRVHAQQLRTNAVERWNIELSKIAFPAEVAGAYKFRPQAVTNPLNFFTRYKSAMGLAGNDEMKLVRTDIDPQGRKHHRFQQYFNGIKIEGAEYIVHEKNNFATSANGKLVTGLNKPVTARLAASAAIAKALSIIPSRAYLSDLKAKTFIAHNTYRPEGELVFQKSDPDLPFLPQHFRLCYHFDIYKASGDGYAVYIDANNGELIIKIPLQSNCESTNVSTNFYGDKTIYTTYLNKIYYLQDNCTNTVISVYDNDNDTLLHNSFYLSANNSFNNSSYDRSAATSLFSCRRTIDFYQSVFARNGYDSKGGDIAIYQNAGFAYTDENKIRRIGYSNASFGGGILMVGNNDGNFYGNGGDDWNALDIMGHEVTHGVTQTSSNLKYIGESGALNESFSDIFGNYVEWWDGGSAFGWECGEDRGAIRDMADPNRFNQPDTYLGSKWRTTTDNGNNDNGNVHTNSGVQNFWFYLLSDGGSGVNDNGLKYNVNGIGIQAAGIIAYNTNVYYLTSSSRYLDARYQSITAAEDYFGICSNEAIQCGSAWYAVGVGGSQATYVNVCGEYTATSPLIFYGVDKLFVSNYCSVTFNPSPFQYRVHAANTIYLKAGFKALKGTNVAIYLLPCDYTNNTSKTSFSARQNNIAQKATPIEKEGKQKTTLTAYPNPVTSLVHLAFTTTHHEKSAVIKVYNAEMREVKQQVESALSAGKQNIIVDIGQFASGIYTIIIQLQSDRLMTKVVLVK